jgi:hypothetical protein
VSEAVAFQRAVECGCREKVQWRERNFGGILRLAKLFMVCGTAVRLFAHAGKLAAVITPVQLFPFLPTLNWFHCQSHTHGFCRRV